MRVRKESQRQGSFATVGELYGEQSGCCSAPLPLGCCSSSPPTHALRGQKGEGGAWETGSETEKDI